MNLYKIRVEHSAPKDSHESIEGYVIADNDEEVFKYIDKHKNYNDWRDRDLYPEEYDSELDDFTCYKDRVIANKGEIDFEELYDEDLYYGKTLYGWELVKEGISVEDSIRLVVLLGGDIAVFGEEEEE